MALEHLTETDPDLAGALKAELARQRSTIELIASENFVSPSVLEAVGSVLTNKYAEGYPGHRYYGGCERVDVVEDLARRRACALFGCAYVNVQPHSGANANLAAYAALLEPGDTVLGMRLDQGGHLTHGSPVNFSGKLYRFVPSSSIALSPTGSTRRPRPSTTMPWRRSPAPSARALSWAAPRRTRASSISSGSPR